LSACGASVDVANQGSSPRRFRTLLSMYMWKSKSESPALSFIWAMMSAAPRIMYIGNSKAVMLHFGIQYLPLMTSPRLRRLYRSLRAMIPWESSVGDHCVIFWFGGLTSRVLLGGTLFQHELPTDIQYGRQLLMYCTFAGSSVFTLTDILRCLCHLVGVRPTHLLFFHTELFNTTVLFRSSLLLEPPYFLHAKLFNQPPTTRHRFRSNLLLIHLTHNLLPAHLPQATTSTPCSQSSCP